MVCFVCGEVVVEPETFIDEDTPLCKKCATEETDSIQIQMQEVCTTGLDPAVGLLPYPTACREVREMREMFDLYVHGLRHCENVQIIEDKKGGQR
jgi:hypothetical protein